MKTTGFATIATLMLTGLTAAGATEMLPAWAEEGFVMEEVVARAEAPASYYMEEIVVTAQAPDHLFMEEVVVVARLPVIAAEAQTSETALPVQVVNPVMEEIVVTARPSDLKTRMAARTRNSRSDILL